MERKELRSDRYFNSSILVGSLIVFLAWMYLGAYQSHYVSALHLLGDTSAHAIVGVPKEGRGDEWSTYLPILKQAYLEGFSERSTLKPYFERLNWFIAIPHKNLSLLFLPNQLAYWVLPGGKALSFQGFYYNALFVISLSCFLINLGVRRGFAIAVAFTVLFTQFYQVWWTSNLPTLGAAILPFAVFTSGLRLRFKIPLLYWTICHMLFGEMYPPFYISLAVAILPFTIAVKPGVATPKKAVAAIVAATAALVTYLYLNLDYVKSVSVTSYPGHRLSVGGGATLDALAALIFPTFPHNAVGSPDATIYTLAVGGTFLPILLLALLPWVRWDRLMVRVTAVTISVVSIIACYMVVGFPLLLAKVTGFALVPGPRMAIGISVLVACYSAFVISRNRDEFRAGPLLLVAAGYAVLSFYVGTDAAYLSNFDGIEFYPYLPFVLLNLSFMAAYFLRFVNIPKVMAVSVVLGMTLAHIIIFGSFNPIMNASDILRPVDSQITRDWRALWEKNGEMPFAVIGNYGHVLRGENLPALEAIHLANVSSKAYQNVFPELSPGEIEKLFNQFRGISFANSGQLDASGATVVFPIRRFAVPFENTVALDDGATTTLLGAKPAGNASPNGSGSFVVRWNSHLANPLPIDTPLTLWDGCHVSDSWVTRYPVDIPSQSLVSVALQGIAGQLTVAAPTEQAAVACVGNLRITAGNNLGQR